jgi:hypothetical protein
MILRTAEGIAFEQRIPKSFAFAEMDDGEFRELFDGLCNYVAKRYWPDLTPAQIEQMAGVMANQ